MSEYNWYEEGVDATVTQEEISTPAAIPLGEYVGSIESAEVSMPEEGAKDKNGDPKYPQLRMQIKLSEALTEGLQEKLYKDRIAYASFYLSPKKYHPQVPTGITKALVTICHLIGADLKKVTEQKVPLDELAKKLTPSTKIFVTGKMKQSGDFRNLENLKLAETPESEKVKDDVPWS